MLFPKFRFFTATSAHFDDSTVVLFNIFSVTKLAAHFDDCLTT